MHDFCLLLLQVTLTLINCAVPLVESTHDHENFCEKKLQFEQNVWFALEFFQTLLNLPPFPFVLVFSRKPPENKWTLIKIY